jgi:prepilin-type N-terminal cleavage/methylation domain-containing protein
MGLIRTNRKRGFTLIELLVVIVILGVLAALGIPAFVSSQRKSRDTRRKEDLSMIAKALEMYNNDTSEYPASNTSRGGSATGIVHICVPGCSASCCTPSAWGGAFSLTNGGNTVTYMQKLPKDSQGQQYYYESVPLLGRPAGYRLFAHLENTDDPDVPKSAANKPQHYLDATNNIYPCQASGTVKACNYVVLSSNVAEPVKEDDD